ncbi:MULTISPECIES: Gfo/Idh/MocA family protein [unclassified Micromonospora]|uniref:Gfo/Idh/MocA family protein n=1 Tax=unclassified Micromonospora TaxID=2617518 RepID=UPI0015927653|nr:Gfo/Idh/MocA family oxidoreductase [Verrucosispora sp. NA02020]QKW13856.1 Gfo/Idh/MocA family oxidoreductase [Verrucosispora sp. NA02020]
MSAVPEVAVVGAGAFGLRHVAAYRSLGVPVTALVDPDPAVRDRAAAAHGVARTFGTVEELLTAGAPQAASVCVPGPAHRAVAVALLAGGVPVLVEKPLAATVADAAAIVAAARTHRVLCQPGHILRHSAPHRALYDAVRAGRLGQVLAVSSRRDRPRALSRLFPDEHPALLTAVHDVDLAIWYAQSPVVEVRATARTRPGPASPVLVWAELRHANDVVSSIRNSYLLPDTTPNHTSDLVEVYGTDGVAHVDLGHPTLLVQAERTEAPDWLLSPADGGGALAAELRHFVGQVTGTESSAVVPLADGLHVVQVATAMADSAAAGGEPRRISSLEPLS